MKKSLLLFVALVLGSLSMMAQAVGDEITYGSAKYTIKGENLFTNGSFEEGVDGWYTIGYTTAADASNFTLTSEGGYDGGAYITTSAAGAGAATSIRQAIAVEAGKTYYFVVYTNGTAPSSSNYKYNALFQMSDATTENGVLKAFTYGDGTTWSKCEYVFTATEDIPYVGVRMSWNSNSSWDGFGLYEIEEAGIDLTAYNAEIATAEALLATYTEGTDWYTSLNEAITAAKATTPTTAEEAATAVSTLQAAEKAAAAAYKKSLYASIEAGTYYIKNNEAGQFLANGAYWGTRSVLYGEGLTYEVTVGEDGKYTLASGIKNATNALRPSDGYNDQSGTWEIYPTDGGVLLYNGSKYFSHVEGSMIPDFVTEATAGSVWSFITPAERKAALSEASASNPVDATAYITAADFHNSDVDNAAWDGYKVGGDNGSGSTLLNNANSEKWNAGTYVVSQTITDLPNGIYTLTAQAFYRHGGTGAGSSDAYEAGTEVSPVLFANNDSVAIKSVYSEAPTDAANGGWAATSASTAGTTYYIPNSQGQAAACFSTGAYVNTIENIEVTDGTLKIGVARTGDAIQDWTVFDSFRLTYYGVPVVNPYEEGKQYKAGEAQTPEVGNYYLMSTTSGFINSDGALTSMATSANYFWQLEDAGDGNYYIKNDNGYMALPQDVFDAIAEGRVMECGYAVTDCYDYYNYAGFDASIVEKAEASKFSLTAVDGGYNIGLVGQDGYYLEISQAPELGISNYDKAVITFCAPVEYVTYAFEAPTAPEGVPQETSTAVTEIESGKFYIIKGYSQTNTRPYLYNNGGKIAGVASPASIDNNHVWYVQKADEEGNYYLYNMEAKQFVTMGTSNGSAVSFTETESTVQFTAGDAGIFAVKNPSANQWIDFGWAGTAPTTWGGSVAGSRRTQIYEVEYVDPAQIALNETMDSLIAVATEAYNNGYVWNMGDGLITSVDQLSSPYTESSEGALANLIDGDASSYWHSSWSGGNVDAGIHYLEIALPDNTLGDIELDLTRRPASNDHLTKADIVGVDAEGNTTVIATVDLPYGSNTETVTARFTLDQAYASIRIVEQATTTNRGYWHASEIQLYPVSLDPTSYNVVNPTSAAALAAAIETAEAVENATQEDIDALQAAYDAYLAGDASGIAEFVSVTPEAGSSVDMDTEYTVTFSKPVTFSTSLSDINIGGNSLGNGNGVTFTLSEDQKTITAKLDPTFLAMFGISDTDGLVEMLGSSLALRIYKVKDVETGEALEGNDPDEEYQFTFNYTLGKPALSIQTQDGRSEEVASISTLYFACNDGVALADATKSILVIRNKQQIATITADQLVAAGSDIDPMDEGDDDNFGVDDQTVQYYSYTFETPLTETGSYEVYVPAGMFLVAGAANENTIGTFLIKGEPTGIEVDPAAGEVESLQDFTFTYNMNEMICPSAQDGTDLTITDADGNVVATITQDDLNMAIDESCLDETGWNVIKCKASLAEAITAPGTYTLHIPEQAFYVGDNYENCEATDFVYTIAGATPDIAGTWYENTTGLYYGNGWEDVNVVNNNVSVTVDGTTATFTGLLGDSQNILTATISGNSLTFAHGQTVYYGGYDWTLGLDEDGEVDLTGTISEDGKTITINDFNIFYGGWSYFDGVNVTLSRESGEEPVIETFTGIVRYMAADGNRSSYITEDVNATMTVSTLGDKVTYSIEKYAPASQPYPTSFGFSVEDGTITGFTSLYYGYAYYLTTDYDCAGFEANGSVFNAEDKYLSFPYTYYSSYNNDTSDEQGTFYFIWGDFDPTKEVIDTVWTKTAVVTNMFGDESGKEVNVSMLSDGSYVIYAWDGIEGHNLTVATDATTHYVTEINDVAVSGTAQVECGDTIASIYDYSYEYAANTDDVIDALRLYVYTTEFTMYQLTWNEDIVTRIAGVAADSKKEIYNVNGVKLNKMQRGINIVNGKKVFKK